MKKVMRMSLRNWKEELKQMKEEMRNGLQEVRKELKEVKEWEAKWREKKEEMEKNI